MSPESFKAFMHELDAPAKPVPELVELLNRKAPLERDSQVAVNLLGTCDGKENVWSENCFRTN